MLIQGYPDPGEGLRLHLNENTGGCSPGVIDAIRRLQPTDISTYPSYPSLVLAIAKHFDVDPEWVLLTNGLDEGILMAAIGHISRAGIHDAETIVPTPAFDPYPNSTAAAGATSVRVPPIADLIRISEAAPHAIVLIDEAYIEFGGESFLPQLPRHPNVLVGRTFSKAYGLAGMRVGIVIGQPPALDPVRAVTLPFNINVIALAAVQAALADTEFLPRYAAQVDESRQRVYAVCRRLGLRYWESAANYVLVQVGDTAPFIQALSARKIHVRDRSKDPATPGCVRITAGMVDHTNAAIEALESVVAA